MRIVTLFFIMVSAALWPSVANAQAAPFQGMALEGGYRLTARHDGKDLTVSWRPYKSGLPGETTISVESDAGGLAPISGSQAAFFATRASLAVVVDTRDEDLLFDQLSAIRVMLAAANFERQTWHFYDAATPNSPIAWIEGDSDLAAAWTTLRSLLDQANSARQISSISAILRQLAASNGDRKALILPQSLMPALQPGLTAQGIAGLQAFGIALSPMTGALSQQTREGYDTLARATGGQVLPWLIVPPNVQSVTEAFAPLIAGGMARYRLPPAKWQPWSAPQPLRLTLRENGVAVLRMDVPLPASKWSDLPWGVIAGLCLGLLVLAIIAIIVLRRQSKAPLRAQVLDVSTGKRYVISTWPSTLGRGEEADITIANAHLAPLHLRFSDNGTGIDIKVISGSAAVHIGGTEKHEFSAYQDSDFETAGVSLRLEFITAP